MKRAQIVLWAAIVILLGIIAHLVISAEPIETQSTSEMLKECCLSPVKLAHADAQVYELVR